jgi:hypothetical protein
MPRSSAVDRTFALGCLLLVGLAGCQFPTGGSAPILVSTSVITFQWDPPASRFPVPPLAVSSYRLYFCRHGSKGWIFVAEVPARDSPEFTLRHSNFGNGSYDFAVMAINSLGTCSPLHSSLDESADPFGGWHIVWVAPD